VLALHGLTVLAADAMSSEAMALEQVRVQAPRDEPVDWPRVTGDLELALAGRLALRARLADRARTYASPGRSPAAVTPRLLVDNEASATATVLEVHAADAVVDAFYVRGADAAKITDSAHLAEIERAVLHALHAG